MGVFRRELAAIMEIGAVSGDWVRELLSSLALGASIGVMSGRNVLGTALRQLAVAAVAAAVTYGVGSLLGMSTS